MKQASCKTRNAICKALQQVRMSERDRQRARYALRDAETIVHALFWAKETVASLGARLPKLGFRH